MLYMADAPYSAYSNFSFLGLTLQQPQIDLVFNNSFNIATQASNTTWATCVACGAVLRSLQRSSIAVPDACQQCFNEHCWNGTYTSELPIFVSPSLLLNESVTYEEWNRTTWTDAANQGSSSNGTSGGSSGGSSGGTSSGGQSGSGGAPQNSDASSSRLSAAMLGLAGIFGVALLL